jgi:hypothetical protein
MTTRRRGHGDRVDAGLVVHERIRQGGLLGMHRLAEALSGKFEIPSEVKRAGRASDNRAYAEICQ